MLRQKLIPSPFAFFSCGKPCLLLLLVFALLFSSCTAPQSQVTSLASEATAPVEAVSQRGIGDTLYILNPQAPTLLNPHLSPAGKDLAASRITYEPLASFNEAGELVPFLAEEIPSVENGGVAADGKSVTWKLKQGVLWSDGEPFTADDVLFTYQFIINPDVKASTTSTYGAVESVEVLDDVTVKINFKDVNPAWALPFVGYQGLILPRHVFENYNGANAKDASANTLPIGTGPYRVIPPGIKPQEVLIMGSQLVKTNKIVYEPNPYFRDPDKPFFRRVELRGGGTPGEAARLALVEGKVDFALGLESLPPATLALYEKEGNPGMVLTAFGSSVERILLNRTDPDKETAEGERSSLEFPHPFFSDKRVRQAFAYAVDREALAALYGAAAAPTTNNLVLPPQYRSDSKFYEYDPARARTLLDEAGWVDSNGDGVREKDGEKLKVVFQAKVSEIVQQTQQLIKGQLEDIGVEVELKIVDSSIMFGPGTTNPDSAFRFNGDIQEFNIGMSNPDPASYMRYWTSALIPQKANDWRGLNIERWPSEAYDALYQQATTELDPELRQQLFKQMNDMLVEDIVMIPLFWIGSPVGISRSLQGVELTPWDQTTWNIMDWRRTTP